MTFPTANGPIGVFDSGYGGLTILRQIRKRMPQMDYLYLGDNARAPYGTRSFQVVYEFTRQAVLHLFQAGCPLVILACNTASAKALRTIQQCDLPQWDSTRRVLGVIRPTAEILGDITRTGHVGVFATQGTIKSQTYDIEIAKLYGDRLTVVGEACPMWVPLVENGECQSPGADFFVQQHVGRLLQRDAEIDTVVLGCTHYPLLEDKIRKALPEGIRLVAQGHYVAQSLSDYLFRHEDMACRITRGGSVRYLTTESPQDFAQHATMFMGGPVTEAEHVTVDINLP